MSSAASSETSDYRLAPPVMARFVGAYLILLAVLLLAATVLVAAVGTSPDLIVVLLVVGVLGLIALSWWMRSKLVVLRLTDAGYRVRMIRAAGVTEARWSEVEDLVAATPRGVECLVIRLKQGGSTTIPVELVAGDKDDVARAVRDRLRRAAR
ncbi:hypothetical protein ACFQ0K_09770 [Nocardioides caeni]|uniref:PH domain-containing protein n=1 Tax=Nocardioides caeni TaxID=574700 RepID=A0A4V4HJP9_9ACTN|nr:hypothetical protein [Nocardioides caeni]THV11236.1 hypothetical protein E9934_13185 [Nocardioides caeni]